MSASMPEAMSQLAETLLAGQSPLASARSSVGASSSQSTPPTSLGDINSEADASKDDHEAEMNRRRSGRARPSVSTYNDTVLSGNAVHTRRAFRKTNDPEQDTGNRSVSGTTLVDDDSELAPPPKVLKELAIDSLWRPADEKTAKLLAPNDEEEEKVVYTVWANGKYVKDGLNAAKDKLLGRNDNKRTRTDDNAEPRRMFPNLKLGSSAGKKEEPKVAEKPKEEVPPKPKAAASKPKRKKYLTKGLYVGQHRNFDPKLSEAKNQKKLREQGIPEENPVLPMPMFLGEEMLKHDVDYKLPFDILNPLPFEEHPKDWKQLSKNRFIGEASTSWKKSDFKKSDYSPCECRESCDERCLNRSSKYECNYKLCDLGDGCGNRPFAELLHRSKNKNWYRRQEGDKPEANLFGVGVEVMKTGDRGHGVRAMRSFAPGQIIVEYCGEIITLEESDRRMNEDYKGKSDFYLMTFDQGLIIDATRGSICRFVNHSCDPNCEVEMWHVNGEPRMGLFAGEKGIMVGEELTYDYNFEVNNKTNVQVCLCGAANCRGILGPTTLAKQSKASKAMDSVKSAVKGVKRKAKEMIGLKGSDGSESETECSRPKRRKILDSKAMLSKMGKQISNLSSGPEPAVPPMSEQELVLQKKSREDRALKRSASLITLNSRVAKGRVTKSRHSTSSFQVSDMYKARKPLNRRITTPHPPSEPASPVRSSTRPKTSKGRIHDLKDGLAKRGEELLKAVMGNKSTMKESARGNNSLSRSKSLASGSSSMRQAKLSFASTGSLGLKLSPEKASNNNDDEEEEGNEQLLKSKGPKIPKRGSSLMGTSASAALKARKTIAVAKAGVLGEAGVRKTARRVSGA